MAQALKIKRTPSSYSSWHNFVIFIALRSWRSLRLMFSLTAEGAEGAKDAKTGWQRFKNEFFRQDLRSLFSSVAVILPCRSGRNVPGGFAFVKPDFFQFVEFIL